MDRENVIRHIAEEIENTKFWKNHYASVSIEVLSDVYELLEEQEDLGTDLMNAVELIHKKNERIEKLLKEQEVVRCKDCIWFHKPDAETKKSCKCSYHGCVTEGDRYCWWGEKDA